MLDKNKQLWQNIEEVIRLAVKLREKEIDANCCQTEFDKRSMRKANEEYEEKLEELEEKVKNL